MGARPPSGTIDLPSQGSDVLRRAGDDAVVRKVPPFPRGSGQAYCADTKLSRCWSSSEAGPELESQGRGLLPWARQEGL